ncbi:hypothetical protein Psta_2988 [Pirellula staleyi DSM 6068]|uniref:Uncharacterized protein n=1 Tax=Pirellula staleyi (strain ATCC 27377 / DSM 6068 / ICPB 4128) TaxID=530564 RepID=D2R9A3_PIRSD|nr:hypothetical protein [Pirellula staleyi]ADB17653.1 hypothetical protein Psta_2988 [Pirellula staleyi DSM 6068]
MKTVLVVFFLSVQSSYSGDTETTATEEAFDTVQFYSANGTNWRIRTYARDQDVHIWSLGSDVADLVALARAHTEKHYGEVLTEGYIIETEEGLEGVRHELEQRGLPPNLELPPSGAVFWAPPGTTYRSRSVPR